MEFLGGFGAVAELVFLVGWELGECFVEVGELKDGVVAKAVVAAGGGGDLAVELAIEKDEEEVVLAAEDACLLGSTLWDVVEIGGFCGEEGARDLVFGEGHGEGGDKAGGALFFGGMLEAMEQELIICLVVGVVAGEAGAVDAGCAVEGVHSEAGVVSEGAAAGGEGGLDSFFKGVFSKGGLVFVDGRQGTWKGGAVVDRPGWVEEGAQELCKFSAFPGVGGGDDKAVVTACGG